MRRRKLAWALAALLVLLALLALSAWAVLVLPKRDYRLVYLLGKTKKIEFSSPWARMTALEITDPGEVAALVSATTAKLDRTGKTTRQIWGVQIHFILNDGGEVALLSCPLPNGPYGKRAYSTSAIRLPSRNELDEYVTSGEISSLLDPRFDFLYDTWVELGTFETNGQTVKSASARTTCSGAKATRSTTCRASSS